jgi:hypothetical protein
MPALLAPSWLIHLAVAAVWLYEGLWCKLLGRAERQREIVEAVPFLPANSAAALLKLLGAVETALAIWSLSPIAPIACASVQTILLVAMNANGLRFARRLIPDPAGMVVKNLAFLVLAWVAASLPFPR